MNVLVGVAALLVANEHLECKKSQNLNDNCQIIIQNRITDQSKNRRRAHHSPQRQAPRRPRNAVLRAAAAAPARGEEGRARERANKNVHAHDCMARCREGTGVAQIRLSGQ